MTSRLLERLIPPAILLWAGGWLYAALDLFADFTTALFWLLFLPVGLGVWWYWLVREAEARAKRDAAVVGLRPPDGSRCFAGCPHTVDEPNCSRALPGLRRDER